MVDVHLMVSEIPGQGRQCRVFASRQAALTFAGAQIAAGGAGVLARFTAPSKADPLLFGDGKAHSNTARVMLHRMAQRSASGRAL